MSGWDNFAPELEFFLASLTDELLASELSWRDSRGVPRNAPYRQVLLHLVNHATYHRGQVAAQLRQLGHTPPGTDLVQWSGSF